MLREFYKVYTLPKPNKLEEFLTKTKPDLFLVDYQMPGINGFDLIPIIRGFPEHKTTPVIFLTGEGTIENINAAIELGACDFIVKPFERYVIRKKVAKHLGIEI
jgi:DNA-binding response OmpR family regulator